MVERVEDVLRHPKLQEEWVLETAGMPERPTEVNAEQIPGTRECASNILAAAAAAAVAAAVALSWSAAVVPSASAGVDRTVRVGVIGDSLTYQGGTG